MPDIGLERCYIMVKPMAACKVLIIFGFFSALFYFSKTEFHGNPEGGPILQHSWNAAQNNSFNVNGLCENTNYR